MDKRPVIFIDSGLGGIPYCGDFSKRNPNEQIYYIADRENFPYGPREKDDITTILTMLTKKIIKLADPKIAVLACNTASISALAPLRQTFPQLPFVGTVPAIKPAANACKSGTVGVLGTERTIKDIRGLDLANNGENHREIFSVAAPELVEFVERRFEKADESEKQQIVKKYIDVFRGKGIDSLVLGCTHFLYLLEEFRREAGANLQIFDSLDGITKRIEYLLDENNALLRAEGILRAGKDNSPVYRFLLTGKEPAESSWVERASALGFNLSLLDETV